MKQKKLGMVVSDKDIQKKLDEIYKTNNITYKQFESMLCFPLNLNA